MSNQRSFREMTDDRLSGIHTDNAFLNVVMSSAGRSSAARVIQKRVILVAALVTVMLAGVALGVATWRETAARIADLEKTAGYFEGWDVVQKTQLLRGLVEAREVGETPDIRRVLEGGMEEKTTASAVDAAITNWLKMPVDAVTLMAVSEKILGPFDVWSVADKAWYSKLTEDSLGSGTDAVVHMEPGDSDVTQEQAKQIASEALRDSIGELPEGWTVYYDFYTTPNAPDGMTPKWVVSFASASSVEYYVTLDGKTGAVIHDPILGLQSIEEQVAAKQTLEDDAARLVRLENELGPQYKWSLEDQAKYLSGHELPREGGLSQEDAIGIATTQLETILSKTGLSGYSAYTSYLVDALNPDQPKWLVLFIKESSGGVVLSSHSVLIDAVTGDMLEIHTGSNG
ncbi:MAG: PepSY domain-containing protein [Oscillospiraceae bacterium]|jgi:hypothetical protein|nr:PepSY domain-containing protein [Oscillospiraceae bacterium]